MASLADAEQTLRSTNATANFLRLTRLLIGGGTKLLQEKFDCIHKPADLTKKLSDPATQRYLNRAHLTQDEKKYLYPGPGKCVKSSDFDITLIFKLFRNICSLTPPSTGPSGSGWDELPNAWDQSLEADLARIKYYRNNIYAHTKTMEIPDDEFGKLWKEISEALLRIAAGISHVKRDEWKMSIDKLMSDDPLTPEAGRLANELQLWYENDRDLKKEMQNVGEKVDGSCEKIETIYQELQRLREDVKQSFHTEENQQKTALERRMEEERNSHLSAQRDLQSAVSAAEHALEEYQRHQSRDWIIHREDVVLSETVLGKGGWGIVREGKFRGCQVAVKEIHELILSDYNRGLFEREMSIASRCRHPSLLQFIGATNDEGSPLFVTELLDTSLRHVLQQRTLNHGEIVTLALDVAIGLNYLHLNRPVPIIHRDISSANVLLWRRDESWRAKLSDYGSANFLRQSMTANPGAVIYSAPEAFTPQHTTKVDVYSFGVLLCEMCIREQPDPQTLRDQICRVTQGAAIKGLIRECTRRHPEKRPTMSEVIRVLDQLV